MQEKKPDNAVILAADSSSRFVSVCQVRYKVGITVGVFDLFHVGPSNLLERCKTMCDHLIVAVCGDDYVTQIKHKTPVYPEDQRRRILAALLKPEEQFAKHGAKIEYFPYTMGVSTKELRLSSTLIHHCRLRLAA